MMIPGVATVHPREAWQDAAFPVTGPTVEASAIDTAVIHYTGSDDLIDGDPGESADDLAQYMRNMQRHYVTARGYSLGYRWAVDWLGGVWQIRGWDLKSAANRDHNHHTEPILVMVDGDDAATDLAAASVRAIIAESQRRSGRDFVIVGHGQLSGAATLCPGVGLRAQVSAGVFTPKPPPPPPPPVDPVPAPVEPEPEDVMEPYIAKPPTPERDGKPWLFVSPAGGVRPATTFDLDDEVTVRDMNKIPKAYRFQQYDDLHRSAGLG